MTTDGFITDIEDLERKIAASKRPLLNEYSRLREELSGDLTALEVKNKGRGVIS